MDWLIRYWPVIVVAVALIATWVRMTSQMEAFSERFKTCATKDDLTMAMERLQLALLTKETEKLKEDLERERAMKRRAGD